jgi:16S rRNA (adenine1518-N6/adenine1519-N6)-dimethyltransferase
VTDISRSDLSLLAKTKFLLRANRILPNRLLGQNFMIEPSILQTMSNYASLDKKDVVVDIGAGLGFLTRSLASKCRSVVAVEIDDKLVKILHEELRNTPNVRIVHGNALKTQVPKFNKIVSIPPYGVSSRLLLWLFSKNFDSAVLVFQKEFADRLVASVGSENYGWLTVLAYYYSKCELLDDIPKAKFYPQPKVDSIIIRLRPKQPPPFSLKNTSLFTKLTQSVFTQRNRKIRNAILPFLKGILAKNSEEAMACVARIPFSDKRVRELQPEDFGALANVLA